MKNFSIIINSILLLFSFFSYSYAVVSAPTPATSNVVNQISSSISHSVVNSGNVIINSQNVTSNLINSTNLKEDIKVNAEKLDLKVDEGALSALSDASSDSEGVVEAMGDMKDNIMEIEDHDYVMTMTEDVIVYDSGWFAIERVETGSNGLTYNKPDTSNVFADAVQEARGKIYVNFNKKEMSSDLFTRITLKGASQVQHEWNSGSARIGALPVVASTVRGLKSDGSTDFDEFVDTQPSMQVAADTLAPNYDPGKTKQELMDWYNHSSDTEADKRLFFYGKFTTVGDAGSPGTGTIVVEGAAHANPDATNATTTASYIATIERLEGSATIEGKALD